MGINLTKIRNDQGDEIKGLTRLYRILVSESAHLIWAMRCKWRIQDEQNPFKVPTEKSSRAKWFTRINKRLRHDRLLTDRITYGRKALKIPLVRSTWEPLLTKDLEDGPPPSYEESEKLHYNTVYDESYEILRVPERVRSVEEEEEARLLIVSWVEHVERVSRLSAVMHLFFGGLKRAIHQAGLPDEHL
ncbi:hypothetical protein CC2G_000916 [Coprinopsis cinerea AmutBmut pab1-1]|nr:hypothetical protein CC2G_000916 [Coprinopsis cinerea AmutBmut pab1-1]